MNCSNCGVPLPDGSRFCTRCGMRLTATAQTAKYCPACGAEAKPGAGFCTACGQPFGKSGPSARTKTQQSVSSSAVAKPMTPPPADGALMPPPMTEQEQAAPEMSGEFSCAEREAQEGAGRSPNYLQRLLNILKQPRTLIPLAALLASWIGLSFARDSQNIAVKLLSWLSFGRGGLGRGFPGNLGGLLGKTAVGTALLGLCSGSLGSKWGGVRSFFGQIKNVFSGKAGAAGIAGVVLGLLLGAGVYMMFAGIKTADWESSMSGVAGAVLSLSALERRAFSQTSGRAAAPAAGGGKSVGSAQKGTGFLSALLAGLAAGCTLCALVLTVV